MSTDALESSIDSDETGMQCAELVFDNQMSENYIASIRQKRQCSSSEDEPAASLFHDYEKSCSVLEAGIKALKYNYSNYGVREVILRLVKNRTAIEYKTVEQNRHGQGTSNSFLNLFRSAGKSRVLPLSDFFGLIYGGSTASFVKHKAKLMSLIEYQQEKVAENDVYEIFNDQEKQQADPS